MSFLYKILSRFRRTPEVFRHAEPGWWRIEVTRKSRIIRRLGSHIP